MGTAGRVSVMSPEVDDAERRGWNAAVTGIMLFLAAIKMREPLKKYLLNEIAKLKAKRI